ncbi:MAG: YajQ family cyclic di-GMP-binding protein [Methylophilaceae bacterium]|nr:YajQ family cyclic di-GMP-binding protein [Methylophilaceae bacterium]
MPSFDISSELNTVALKNALDITERTIATRYDFKGSSAKVEWSAKDLAMTLFADNDFQLKQILDILLPNLEKKEADSSKRLQHQEVQKISGNKVKQVIKVRSGIDAELAKRIVKILKDSGLKVQSSIQGEIVRVSGAKRDVLQEAIEFTKKTINDFPLQFANFRD